MCVIVFINIYVISIFVNSYFNADCSLAISGLDNRRTGRFASDYAGAGFNDSSGRITAPCDGNRVVLPVYSRKGNCFADVYYFVSSDYKGIATGCVLHQRFFFAADAALVLLIILVAENRNLHGFAVFTAFGGTAYCLLARLFTGGFLGDGMCALDMCTGSRDDRSVSLAADSALHRFAALSNTGGFGDDRFFTGGMAQRLTFGKVADCTGLGRSAGGIHEALMCALSRTNTAYTVFIRMSGGCYDFGIAIQAAGAGICYLAVLGASGCLGDGFTIAVSKSRAICCPTNCTGFRCGAAGITEAVTKSRALCCPANCTGFRCGAAGWSIAVPESRALCCPTNCTGFRCGAGGWSIAMPGCGYLRVVRIFTSGAGVAG